MAFSKTIQMYIFDGNPTGMVVYIKYLAAKFQNLLNVQILKTPEYIFYSVKMMKITILFISAKLKKCSLACVNI